MELIKVILGVKHKDQTGPGLPRGLVMEIRAVALVLVLLAIFLGGWFWMKNEEKEVYVRQGLERIQTAAGGEAGSEGRR